MVYETFLAAEDTTFASKASKKMPGVQKWKDHSGYIFGHHGSILGLPFPLFRTVALLFDYSTVDSRQEEPLSLCIHPGGFTTGRIFGCDGLKRPAFVGCTDLTLNEARFSLEITIRDLKQHVGFGDYQSTTTIDRFMQLCCTAFCIWKLMMLLENAPTWLDDGKPTVLH